MAFLFKRTKNVMVPVFKPKKRSNIEKTSFFSYNSKVDTENLKEHLS